MEIDGTTPAAGLTPEQVAQIKQEAVKEIFGDKYQGDINKAKEGHWQLVNYASNLAHEREALAAQTGTRVNPGDTANAREVDPWNKVGEVLPDVSNLRAAVAGDVRAAVAAALNPVLTSMAARQTINKTNPGYVQNEDAVLQFLQNNPQIHAQVYAVQEANMPLEAMNFAYAAWEAAQKANAAVPPKPEVGIPGSGFGTPPGMAPPSQPGLEALVDLIQRAQASREEQAVRNVYGMAFGNYNPTIPPQFLQR